MIADVQTALDCMITACGDQTSAVSDINWSVTRGLVEFISYWAQFFIGVKAWSHCFW